MVLWAIFFVSSAFAGEPLQVLIPSWPKTMALSTREDYRKVIESTFPRAHWIEFNGKLDLPRSGHLRFNFVKSLDDLGKFNPSSPMTIQIWQKALPLMKERKNHFFANVLQSRAFVLNQLNCPGCISAFLESDEYPLVITTSKALYENLKSPKINVENTSPYIYQQGITTLPQKTSWAMPPLNDTQLFFVFIEIN